MRLYALAEAVGETLTESRCDLYLQALSDLPPKGLVSRLGAMLLTAKWFPKIPEIREAVAPGPDSLTIGDAKAEEAWQHVLEYADNWHPDIGAFRDCRTLTEREIYALRSVGGILQVQENQCGGKALPFIKRDFVAVWKRCEVTEGLALNPDTRPEPKQLAGGFQKAFEAEKPN